jgi:hypothetical protein
MTLKKQEMFLVYAVAGILGFFVLQRVVFAPFGAKLADLDRDIILKQARFKKGITLLENREAIEKEYGKFDSYFSLHSASGEEAVAAFLKEIEKVSRSSKVLILDVKPQKEPEEDKSSRQYQINVKAEAGMEDLVKFLYDLHNSALLFSVERLVVVPKGDNASVLSITMTLVGVVFK